MNFIENESAEKLRGGFYTDPDIAAFLTRWVLANQPRSLLEPSCGDGAFLEAVLARPHPALHQVLAYEMDPAEAAKAQARCPLGSDVAVEVRTGDFLEAFLLDLEQGAFDGVVGNPPFIRYQYLGSEQQVLAEKIFARCGIPFTRHTNAWVPFVIGAICLMAPGARLGMVVPSEILHIRHAQGLRRYLEEHCSRVVLLDPETLWFGDAQQGVVLLLAEKKTRVDQPGQGVAIQPVCDRAALTQDPAGLVQHASFISGGTLAHKWMPLLLSPAERSLLSGIQSEQRCPTFAQIADVDVGIVTGANSFFLVPDQTVEEFGLRPWAHPMFGRSEHVTGLIFGAADHQANRQVGLPSNFLWFDDAELAQFPASVQKYLRQGEELGLHRRYKCTVRRPWYRVPSVYAAPVAMLKRAHHFPRLILNHANAYTTDTAYRIRPKQVSPASLVFSSLNSLTCLGAELEGRHYGGGVLELVPSEIERLMIPIRVTSELELRALDQRFRTCSLAEDILFEQDTMLLPAVGLSAQEGCTLHQAWDKLRRRRQRTAVAPSPVPEQAEA